MVLLCNWYHHPKKKKQTPSIQTLANVNPPVMQCSLFNVPREHSVGIFVWTTVLR